LLAPPRLSVRFCAVWGGRPSVPKKIQDYISQAKSREPYDFSYFEPNGPTVLGQIFGSTVGDFSKPLRKNGSIFGNFLKNPKNVGQKKIIFCRTRAVRYVIGTLIKVQRFVFQKIFLYGKVGENMFWPPQPPPDAPQTPDNQAASGASLGNMFGVLLVLYMQRVKRALGVCLSCC
jgi:hypothetical protein